MSIPALRLGTDSAAPQDVRAVRCELDPAALAELKARVSSEGAAAYVVRTADLQAFRALGELVIDRGQKLAKKELAAVLLGQTRIPVIDGSYRSGGQLQRSVRTLLHRGAARGERNLFIIGAADAIFDECWRRAATEPTRSVSDADRILDLLPPMKVPEELTRRYIGQSKHARLVRHLIMRAADHDDAVLIQGETGTGKEIVARSIHEYSRRRVETFISVNCAAIPADLFESELFGHEPESFTGAVHRKLGLWRAADRGTLFLDEIGDLRPDHQAKILRSLQEGTVRPIGGLEVKVRARVITATHRDLAALVKANRFRDDLYYRLKAFVIPTPAINRYPEDVPLLAQAFWKAITRVPNAALPADVVEALASQNWPGNARELRAVLSNLHALFGRTIRLEHLDAVARLQSVASRHTGATALPPAN